MLKKKLVILTLFFLILSSKVFASNDVGIYESSYYNLNEQVNENIHTDIYEDLYYDIEEDVYLNDFSKFLSIKLENDEASFISYFNDWQKNNLDTDFYQYAKNRSDNEIQIRKLYKKAVMKFGIGSVIVITPFVISFFTPAGPVALSFLSIGTTALKFASRGALIGATIEAITQCYQSYNGVNEESIKERIARILDAGATGFLTGAIAGSITEARVSYKLYHNAAVYNNSVNGLEGKIVCGDGKIRDFKGKVLGNFTGDLHSINGRAIINDYMAGKTNKKGVRYVKMLADDGKGNFFTVTQPDFSKSIIAKYRVPRHLWSDLKKTIEYCQKRYIKDLSSKNATKIFGISKKEVALRLQYEKGLDPRNPLFLKNNKITENEVTNFMDNYSKGAWHHNTESGTMVYVPIEVHEAARHTGGNSFWGQKNNLADVVEEILW